MKEPAYYATDFEDDGELCHETVDEAVSHVIESVEPCYWPEELVVTAYVRSDAAVPARLADSLTETLLEELYDDLGGPANPLKERIRILGIVERAISEAQAGCLPFHCKEDRNQSVVINLVDYTQDSEDKDIQEWRKLHGANQ